MLKQHQESEFVANLLCYIFLTTEPNCTIKKTLWRTLINSEKSIVIKALSWSIKYIIDSSLEETNIKKLCETKANIITNFGSCFDNFPAGIVALSEMNEIVILFTVEHFMQLVCLLS